MITYSASKTQLSELNKLSEQANRSSDIEIASLKKVMVYLQLIAYFQGSVRFHFYHEFYNINP